MKIAFVEQLAVEVMGIMHVSAMLRSRGHETRLFIDGLERDVIRAILDFEPDIVAMQTRTGQHVWALWVGQRIKSASRAKVVLGGPHVTYLPETITRRGVDIIVRGEADYVMADLCDAIAARDDFTKIPGVWSKDEHGNVTRTEMGALVTDMDAIPMPDRELVYRYGMLRRRGGKTFIGGRGCAYPCTFCHNHLGMELYGTRGTKWVRKRSPELFVEEMVQVRDRFGPLHIINLENDDDILNARTWAVELFTQIKRRLGLPYYIMTRPDQLDADIVAHLKDTGCVAVALSLETVNEDVRNKVLKKHYTTEDFMAAMDRVSRAGMRTKVFSSVGTPGESLADAIETLKANIKINPTWARCSVMTPYPPMDLYEKSKANGWFKNKGITEDDFSPFYFNDSLLDIPDIDRMVNLQKFFSLTVKFPFLLPLVERLIKLDPNKVFEQVGMLTYGIFGARYDAMTLREFVELAMHGVRMGPLNDAARDHVLPPAPPAPRARSGPVKLKLVKDEPARAASQSGAQADPAADPATGELAASGSNA
ncbi:MAG: radical SAM protein [Byssovorax sp.]